MPTNREIYFSLLKENNKYLTRNVIKSLISDVNGFDDDMALYKNFDMDCLNIEKLNNYISKVKQGEPYQYVLGYSYFIGRQFNVDSNVLIPRQETEDLVFGTKHFIDKYYSDKDIILADVCAGSGCIGLSLKMYFPNANIYLCDYKDKCIDIVKNNAKLHGLKVNTFIGDMVEPLIKNKIKLDCLVCNPPYIEDVSTIDEQVWKYEPHDALIANPKTTFYEKVLKHADEIMNANCIIAFELGEDMEEEISVLIEKYMPTAAYKIAKDMYNKIRFAYIIRREDMNYA